MPIEIRELVIRTTVVPERRERGQALPRDVMEKLKRELVKAVLDRLEEERAWRTRRR